MQLIPIKYYVETTEDEGIITLELRSTPISEKEAWVVYCGSEVLTRELEFVYEPQPSSRTEEFIRLTRFATKEEALNYWERYKRLAPK